MWSTKQSQSITYTNVALRVYPDSYDRDVRDSLLLTSSTHLNTVSTTQINNKTGTSSLCMTRVMNKTTAIDDVQENDRTYNRPA